MSYFLGMIAGGAMSMLGVFSDGSFESFIPMLFVAAIAATLNYWVSK